MYKTGYTIENSKEENTSLQQRNSVQSNFATWLYNLLLRQRKARSPRPRNRPTDLTMNIQLPKIHAGNLSYEIRVQTFICMNRQAQTHIYIKKKTIAYYTHTFTSAQTVNTDIHMFTGANTYTHIHWHTNSI